MKAESCISFCVFKSEEKIKSFYALVFSWLCHLYTISFDNVSSHWSPIKLIKYKCTFMYVIVSYAYIPGVMYIIAQKIKTRLYWFIMTIIMKGTMTIYPAYNVYRLYGTDMIIRTLHDILLSRLQEGSMRKDIEMHHQWLFPMCLSIVSLILIS